MKRKTAIEECIEFTESSAHRETKARKELRALMRLAKLTAFAMTHFGHECDWDVHNAKVDREVARLRRLGVLPEVRRG